MRSKWQRGQVGMTVLLILVVMVTIAVAVASRSVSNLQLTRKEQESTRSLDLAETGIEKVLNDLASINNNETKKLTVGSSEVFVTRKDQNSIEKLLVKEGHAIDVALAATNRLTINWADSCSTLNAVIEVALLKDDGANGKVSRMAFEKINTGKGFTTVTDCVADIPNDEAPTDPLNTYALARIKVLREEAVLTITGEGLPYQGVRATATASDADDVTATVEKTQYRGSLPSIFDYVVFSGTDITQ